ncbi:MAG: LacI family DNA-binding transcriptional regulator, partial [Chitinophagaceae bacterium]
KGVTLKDIATKLNMSISTISKALSNDSSISILTRERVHKLAQEWNYIPNESARHFKLNKSFTIGLIIPDLLDQFYVLAINGVESIAEKEKYNVILSQSHEDVDKEEKITNVMISNRVDGVIVAITKNTFNMLLFQKLLSVGIPVVCIAREPTDHSFNYVLSDNKNGALKATEFLVKKKHSRIAHIMGPINMQTCQDRFEGYKLALQKHRISFDADLVKTVDFTKEATTKAMKELMKLKSPPTAIFTFKNYITIDAIEFLKTKHPEKLDVIDFVGFGNLPLLQYMDYKPAAVIDENSFEMGIKSAQLLFKIIHEENQESNVTQQNIQIPCKLIVY